MRALCLPVLWPIPRHVWGIPGLCRHIEAGIAARTLILPDRRGLSRGSKLRLATRADSANKWQRTSAVLTTRTMPGHWKLLTCKLRGDLSPKGTEKCSFWGVPWRVRVRSLHRALADELMNSWRWHSGSRSRDVCATKMLDRVQLDLPRAMLPQRENQIGYFVRHRESEHKKPLSR